MTDLKDYINEIIKHAAPGKNSLGDIIAFLENNNWFGCKPAYADGKVMLDDHQVSTLTPPLMTFLQEEQHSSYLIAKIKEKFPLTAKQLKKFCSEEKFSEDTIFYLSDFLLYRMRKDLVLCNDDEISALVAHATMDLTKHTGDVLTFFLAWIRSTTKTAYHRDYIMERRFTMTIQNEAYDFNSYLELIYYLFNEDYISENKMYQRAARSKNCTDTWLYISMHFVCALRSTDLARIYHPILPYPAEEVIEKIYNDDFTDNDARNVLLSITQRMCMLPFTPNKTASTSGVDSVKLVIPTSCESHFGKLFALAEAHRQLDGTADEPIIRRITKYDQISRYMGSEIGELFIESDFRSRSATKSYLQSLDMLAEDVLGHDENGPNVRGYFIAAIARSHKGSYGNFASTTFEYLKDAKFSGLSPEFVAFELLERGVMSFMPSMLLKMITGGEYSKLSVQQQTSLTKTLDLSPREIDAVVSIVDRGRRMAELALRDIISPDTDILAVLHRIGSGEAFSKQAECLCLLSAIKKVCPYTTKQQCVGCEYEVSTKSTFFLMTSEYNRMYSLYKAVENPAEKNKYYSLLKTIILPKMAELLTCIKENYGDEVFAQYEEFIKENIAT